MIRSLRWRLVLGVGLIIAAVVAAVGVFSSITVRREFDRYLNAERRNNTREALELIRAGGRAGLDTSLARVYDRWKLRTIVTDERGRVLARHPAEMNGYRFVILRGGGVELSRSRDSGHMETMRLIGNDRRIDGLGTVYVFPQHTAGDTFRSSVDRWLLAGLGLTVLVAVLVIVTLFRRVFAPVEALTDGARALAAGRLDTRVAVRGDDEVAELARAFNSMAEALERNERARRNMVSDVAHELRTPLTNIRVQVEAAQDGVIATDAAFLASIEEEAALLARLVEDLQQLSLADAGQLRLELADVAVAELVARAVSGLATNGIAIRRHVPPELVVFVDARRMVQVLRNLVVNAIKYAQSEISISAAGADGRVILRIADDGPGVPAEHAERIFDRFYRADASRSRTTGGAGLGLAIVKQLTELHGGSVRYEKPAFVISLPS